MLFSLFTCVTNTRPASEQLLFNTLRAGVRYIRTSISA